MDARALRRLPIPSPARGARLPRPRAVAGWCSRNRAVLLFLVALLALDAVVGRFAAVWDRHSPDDYAARVNGCRARPRDFVLLGGSPVSEGLVPEAVAGGTWRGHTLADGYAVGLPGGTASEFWHAAKLSCPTPPKLIVYGATASDWNDARNEPHGPYSLMGWGDLAEWVWRRPNSAEWVTRHFVEARFRAAWSLYRYRHGIRMWAALEADRRMPGCCPESTKKATGLRDYADALRTGSGYAPASWFVNARYDLLKAAGWKPPGFHFLEKYRTGAHLTYLHKLIDWSEARGTAFVILDMPVTADLEARYPAAYAEYRQRLAEVEAGRGVTVIRATRDAVGLTDAHFADMIHLNGDGAKRLSGWLRGRLAEER